MPTNRTPIRHSRNSRITPEAVEAYRRAMALHNANTEDWEEDGGNRREYLDARSRLEDLLGRTACDINILDTLDDYVDRWGEPEEFQAALEIRLELERLAKGS